MESNPSIQPHAIDLSINLLQLLSNSLVLYQTTPYLPVSALLAVGATSKSFNELVHVTPNVFRHVDLTKVKQAQFEIAAIDHGGEVWRNVQLDENVTEDDFYGGPLRGIFNTLKRRHILRDVQTLVLDGLSVTSDLVCEILLLEDYNVRLLSIREVQNMNEHKLQQALIYSVRGSRPANTPTLQGLYIFGPKDASPVLRFDRQVTAYPAGIDPSYGRGVTHSNGAQIGARWNQKSGETLADELESGSDKWYQASGKVIAKVPSQDWAHAMFHCAGIISFDAVLCHGPRHSNAAFEDDEEAKALWYHSRCSHLSARVATHALGGCVGCGKAPEGFSKFGVSPLSRFPLLAPPTLHSSTAKAAKTPFLPDDDRLLVRCVDCLKGRFCENCNKWWCEDCYKIPDNTIPQGSPELEAMAGTLGGHPEKHVKVHMGLCVEECLVAEMMSGAGSNGIREFSEAASNVDRIATNASNKPSSCVEYAGADIASYITRGQRTLLQVATQSMDVDVD
ncbi:uncharacterized protein PAC_16247 [Phialocephala subalpina]|uniref:Ubiquitin-protein ligase E3A N-terminal zinc-binding domain-containing protein n=1 Tax=Phialocephala subalpina TaxID=576137 RepID=A0A1L7XN40_9HELO|nr:uncharacterized protein PAC_16247 [Phialocephala subalpina]